MSHDSPTQSIRDALPEEIIKWMRSYPNALIDLSFLLPMNAARAARQKFQVTYNPQQIPPLGSEPGFGAVHDQASRYATTFVPTLSLIALANYAEWRLAMERYIAVFRVIDHSGRLAQWMTSHADNVDTIYRSTQGRRGEHAPFLGKPFWQYYDLEQRSRWYTAQEFPFYRLDQELVGIITLAQCVQPATLDAPRASGPASARRPASNSPPPPDAHGEFSGSATKKAKPQLLQQCHYFNSSSTGCKFSANECQKQHSCYRCGSTAHGLVSCPTK
jgi:hypothetical protein